ncbi:TniB family NTP-binding protein [Sulfitobacter sp. 1A16787]|uniref:TniB family NTP-binding protein n=1 Tax=Sulfitobacter sp. 1A16787 TaxID=3368571 RepID=UPI003746507B
MTTHASIVTLASIERAIQQLSAIHVETQRDDQTRTAFNRLFFGEGAGFSPRFFAEGQETRGVAIVGAPGSGKTALVSHILSEHPSLHFKGELGVTKCLQVTVPSPATLKSVGLELLKALGYPQVSERRERWAIWEMVKHRLSVLGIKVLWIDEAHDIYNAGNVREKEDLLKTLKSLMQGPQAIVVVLCGTEPVAELLRSDHQVARRFSQVRLPPISFASDGDGLMNLIRSYAGRVELGVEIDPDLTQCLLHAARDQFGMAIEIAIGAIETALRSRRPSLTRQDFIDYWFMQESCPLDENVFTTGNYSAWEDREVRANRANSGKGRRQ